MTSQMPSPIPLSGAEPGELTPLRWFWTTVGAVALLVALSMGIAWQMDVFGVFRDAHGRSLVTSDHERKAKYLLNEAYVPANFDALIVGASASINWHLESLTGYRFYNESLEGGDASEQRKLVEQALQHGHFKVAIVGIYPRITMLHVLQDGFDKASRIEALGSISAYSVELDVLRHKLLHEPSDYTDDGSHQFPAHAPTRLGLHWVAIPTDQDPVALEDYLATIRLLEAHGVRIVYMAYPMFEDALGVDRPVVDGYLQHLRPLLPPAPLIDFNGPAYKAFRSDPNNFIDEVHLSRTGSVAFSHLVNDELHKALGDRP